MSRKPPRYTPYEETFLEVASHPLTYILMSPWFRIEIPSNAENQKELQDFAQEIDHNVDRSKFSNYDSILANLAQLPLVYIYPRIAKEINLFSSRKELSLEPGIGSPYILLNEITKDDQSLNAEQRFTTLRWKWEYKKLHEFSKIPQSTFFDPIAAFSFIRRLWSFDRWNFYENSLIVEKMNQLLVEDEEALVEVIRLFIIQTRYVAEHSKDSIEPAAQDRLIKDQVTELIDSRTDRIPYILESLQDLDNQVGQKPKVFWQTRALTALLKFAATRHLLGFACIVEIFTTASQSRDPYLPKILEQTSSGQKAALSLKKYYESSSQNLNLISGFHIALRLSAINNYGLEAALRLSELAILLEISLMNRLEREIDFRMNAPNFKNL